MVPPQTASTVVAGIAGQVEARRDVAVAQSVASTQAMQPRPSGSDGWLSSAQWPVAQPAPAGLQPRKRPPSQAQAAVAPQVAGGHQQSVVKGTQPGVCPQAHSSSPAHRAARAGSGASASLSGRAWIGMVPGGEAASQETRATTTPKMPQAARRISRNACKESAHLYSPARTLPDNRATASVAARARRPAAFSGFPRGPLSASWRA